MTLPQRLKLITDSKRFNFLIVGLIVLTSLFIGLDTYPSIRERWGTTLEFLDKLILGIFVLEQALRLGAEGRRPWRYFADPWNVFDFAVIVVCLLPLGQSSVAVVRLVRILRVLRLLKAIPRLRMLVGGMVKSLSSIGYVAILLGVNFYLFAVLGVSFFHQVDPEHFANLQTALLTLFQLLTLENWPDLMAPAKAAYPVGGPAYFMTCIVVGTMIILNLFVGVIVSGMSSANEEMERDLAEAKRLRKLQEGGARSRQEAILAHVENVEKELQSLKAQLALLLKHEAPPRE